MTLSKEEAERIVRDRDDLAMLRHPELWPRPGIVYVKKYPPGKSFSLEDLRTGLVLNTERGLLLMPYPHPFHPFHQFTKAEADATEPTTPEAIVAAGWVVD